MGTMLGESLNDSVSHVDETDQNIREFLRYRCKGAFSELDQNRDLIADFISMHRKGFRKIFEIEEQEGPGISDPLDEVYDCLDDCNDKISSAISSLEEAQRRIRDAQR